MIGYFPKPYNDELYYSILARYHAHIGSNVKSSTLNELIGKDQLSDFELPVGVNKLVSEVQQFSKEYCLNYFIYNHTLIPLLKAFKSEEWLKRLMHNQFKSSNKVSLFGKLRGDVKPKEHLYYCPQCLKEQYDKYGEGYWKRIHQIPGIFVCNKHSIPLSKYPISLDILRMRSHKFVLPSTNEIKICKDDYDKEIKQCLLNLTEDVEYILEKKVGFLTEDQIYKKYDLLFQIRGIAFPTLKRQEKLNEVILGYYPIKFLELLNSSFKANDKSSWLKYTNSVKSLKYLHPIRHLLLIRSICGSARNFFEKEYTFEPFGKGPWICMNALADHYLEMVVEKVDISINRSNREIQGDMICSCGFIYRLREGEKNPLEVSYFSNRTMKRGHIWEERFDELINQDLTTHEIAKRTHLSKPTIRKILKDRDNVNKDKIQKEKIKRKQEKKTKDYKIIWLNLRKNNPTYTRKELNNINRAVYNWLRKYDVKWLEDNSPNKKVNHNYKKRNSDLQKIDTEFSIKLKETVKRWSDYEKIEGKLVRKSTARIADLIGLRKPLNPRRENMPLTFTYLDSAYESVEEFQKRKVRYFLETKFKNEKVSINKIAEATGIRKNLRKGVGDLKEYTETLVENHNKVF